MRNYPSNAYFIMQNRKGKLQMIYLKKLSLNDGNSRLIQSYRPTVFFLSLKIDRKSLIYKGFFSTYLSAIRTKGRIRVREKFPTIGASSLDIVERGIILITTVPSSSERGSRWRCKQTKNNHNITNQASVKYPMFFCKNLLQFSRKRCIIYSVIPLYIIA